MSKYDSIEEQKAVCGPLIEEERQVYIKTEHGRLQGVMNTAYWDSDVKEYKIFHFLPELNPALDEVGDPYELSMEEIASLPYLRKRLERGHTVSHLDLYPVFPEEKIRFRLLGEMSRKLRMGELCSPEEVDQLEQGHDGFIHYKTDETVKIIM